MERADHIGGAGGAAAARVPGAGGHAGVQLQALTRAPSRRSSDACSRAENTEMGLRVYQVRAEAETSDLCRPPAQSSSDPPCQVDGHPALGLSTSVASSMRQLLAATAGDEGRREVQPPGVRVGHRRLQVLALRRPGRRAAHLQRHAAVRDAAPCLPTLCAHWFPSCFSLPAQ